MFFLRDNLTGLFVGICSALAAALIIWVINWLIMVLKS